MKTPVLVTVSNVPPRVTQLFDLKSGEWFEWENGLGILLDTEAKRVVFFSKEGRVDYSDASWVNRVVRPLASVQISGVVK